MKTFKKCLPSLTALSLALAAAGVHADERESLEALRQTTLGLIDALVDKGILTRAAADDMLRQARQRASAAVPAANPAEVPARAEAAASGKPVQRIPYVSEAMKAQIRNEVREEVLTQARAERWGVPNATPSWVDRIKIEGDFRFRHQSDRMDKDNTPAALYVQETLFTDTFARSLDFAGVDGSGNATASTTDSRSRERLRMRLGLSAKVSDEVGFGLRLATGNATDRVSTNQTLGQNFNKYQLFVDRAFVRIAPYDGVELNLGRIPNPWFGTDLVWSENLNFEGAALTARWVRPEAEWEPFATVGAFPLRENAQPARSDRWLYGAQVGSTWNLSARTRLKFGVAYYQYHQLEGREDLDFNNTSGVRGPAAGQYAYDASLDQKGNTQFVTNAAFVNTFGGEAEYGLAYRFKPVVLTASAEFRHFSPYSLLATAEFVRNTAFSKHDFLQRAGGLYAGTDPGGDPNGYHLKLGFGHADVREPGDWQATVAYKRLGSDAVLDAFTDSDLGLGGTNVQGFVLGLQYGVYRNTSLNVRYLSSRSIDSPINDFNPDARFGVRTLQVDLNVRF